MSRLVPALASTVVALGCLLLYLHVASVGAQPSPPETKPSPVRLVMPVKWEYATVQATKPELSGRLRSYGEQAWELVTVVKDPDDRLYVAYLKRPVFESS